MSQKSTSPQAIFQDQAIHLSKAKSTGAAARLEWVTHAYLRIISLTFLALAVWVWASAVGFEGSGSVAFSSMERAQQIYTVVGAVLFPVVSVGLWSTLSWGRVVWVIAILLQIAGSFLYGEAPMRNDALVFFHLVALALYLLLAGARLIRPNKR
ncbi:MAG: DUF6163 family protein [Pseudomonadota bacterium]